MKFTLVLCVLALVAVVVLGSGGDSHGDDAHGSTDGHGADAGGHGDAGHGDSGHGDGGHGNSSATNLQFCSTLFSFVVLAALNKLR